METKKKKLKTLQGIRKLHQNLNGLLIPEIKGNTKTYKVSFEVKDNNALISNIASLLETCVFALDGNGMLLSPANKHITKHDSVCRVLELVLDILPDSQMYFMDKVTEKLSVLEKNTKNK